MEFVEDGQKGAAVEPLVTVPPDVEATRGQPLRELADVEDGGHQKPEAVAIEEVGGGGGRNEGGGGGGVRRPGEEAVEDWRGRDEEREEEHKGSDDVSILPPPLASIAARQDANDRHKTCARNVEGLEENAELWDCIGGWRRHWGFIILVHMGAVVPSGLHYPRPRVDVVVVSQRWAHSVGADSAIIHKEADFSYHQRHGVEQVGHAARH